MATKEQLSPARRPDEIKMICVYGGFRDGAKPEYVETAKVLGTEMAKRGIGIVYGGGVSGVMGAAPVVIGAAGGKVVAIAPKVMHNEVDDMRDMGEIVWVDSMHERKALMVERSDAFIALPGGVGTLEELFETSTGSQLGMHRKPIGVLNVCGYYDHMIGQIDHMVAEGFLSTEMRSIFVVDSDPLSLLEKLLAHTPPQGYYNWKKEEK